MAKAMGSRRELIRDELLNQGEIEFSTLAMRFRVSEMTIRRDIESLEAEGVARKIIGGAIALGKSAEPTFEARSNLDVESKQHMAEAVVGQLSAHETVILDSGSTVLAVARAIRGRALGLTVITPSLLVAIELSEEPDTSVLVTGGLIRPGELSLIGAEAAETYRRYNCDTFVMGVAGVHEQRGFTDYHRDESAVKRAAIDASDRLIVVADHSKMGRAHFCNIAPLSAADVLVTDEVTDSPLIASAVTAGVSVISSPHPTDTSSETAQ
ncbi:DeoR/GlpR family DNA-binding transcription regulator [Streptomyces sp. NPDC056716]|uniref:DeoR/GlpR family DNA-binding transcription regulator n=1 Tax=unclassified Streptomyces TaxID=2593676 RepID=UPI0036978FC0